MYLYPRKWLCFVTLVSDVNVLSTSPTTFFIHTPWLGEKLQMPLACSPKIKCMHFMETLCSSGAFGARFMFAGYVLIAEIVSNCITEVVSHRLKITFCPNEKK